MTVSEAREFVRQFARTPSGDESVYSDADVDRAIMLVCDDWLEHARTTFVTDRVACSAGTAAISLSGLAIAQMSDLISVSGEELDGIGGFPVDVRPVEEVRQKLKEAGENEGRPQMIGVEDESGGGFLWPVPDDAYELVFRHFSRLDTDNWTIGGGDAPTTAKVVNVADHYLRQILMYGATAVLQHADVEQRFATAAWQKYMQFRDLVALRRVWAVPVRSAPKTMLAES